MFSKDYKQDILKIQKKLKRKLSASRYNHTLGVSYTAGCLGMKYELDVNKLMIAGLLHDCAKYMTPNELLSLALKKNLDITEIERLKPDLLHAKVGAYFAQKKYHIKDKDILAAITTHTTGKPDMSIYEKIIYISDYIEPGRDKLNLPRIAEIRKEAFTDLDKCVKMITYDTLNHLKETGVMIDDMTQKTFDYYNK